VAWSPDGAYILGGGWDGQLILWEAQSGEISTILREPDLSITGDVIQWQPNGSLVAVGNYGGTVKVWNPFSGHIAHELATGGTTLDVAWSADGVYLAALEAETIYVWETNEYTLTQTIPLTEYGDIYSIDFNPNGLNMVYYADNASQSAIQTSSLISLPITTPTPPASGRWGK
jgi:WD40 repeat protein